AALRRDDPGASLLRLVRRELTVTAGVAAAGALLLVLTLGHWGGLGRMGVAAGVAVFLAALAAALVGAAIPLLARLRRKGPSTASLQVAAVVADILGLGAYLWVMRG
ncbi:MAG: magnesium transporter, partial [Armatimonadota bacterium]|nr:magnesium transporter [Armatimonadota bacterium]